MPAGALITGSLLSLLGNIGGSATVYFHAQAGAMTRSGVSSEVQAKTPWRVGGIFSDMRIMLSSNRGALTMTSRINGVDGNLTLTTGANPSGEYIDTTHSDSISSGDLVNWKVVNGAGGNNTDVGTIGALFSATGTTVIKFGWANELNITSNPSTTVYSGLTDYDFAAGSGNNLAWKPFTEGTLSHMHAYLNSNARTTTMTAGSFVNGSAGNIIISVPAGGTGLFEDTTHSDFINVGDLVHHYWTQGSGAGSHLRMVVGFDFQVTNGVVPYFQTATGGSSSTQSFFYGPMGSLDQVSSETVGLAAQKLETTMSQGGGAKNLRIYITTSPAIATFQLRVNAVASALLVTIPSLASAGWYADTTHIVSVLDTDDTSTRMSAINGHAWGTIQWELDSGFVDTNIKSIDGVIFASVKTVNGLAKASMKSIDGLQ